MTDTGPNNPGTMADDDTVGTATWANVDRVKVSDGSYSQASADGDLRTDNEIKIVQSNGSIGTENKASGDTWPTSDAYASYGGSSDLWSESWANTDINNSNFGAVVAANVGDDVTHYLKATNFGFSIPSGATIDGILVEVERKGSYSGIPDITTLNVDHMRITITYTATADSGTTTVTRIGNTFVTSI